jgi:hypothetical protein
MAGGGSHAVAMEREEADPERRWGVCQDGGVGVRSQQPELMGVFQPEKHVYISIAGDFVAQPYHYFGADNLTVQTPQSDF